jgi:spore maturation protein CgeB
MFYQSLISDWRNGSAHFLRGIATELQHLGHEVSIYEPKNGWSRESMVKEHGKDPIRRFRSAYPTLSSHLYDLDMIDLDLEMAGVDVVMVHALNEPALIERLGEHRAASGGYSLLFHDCRHRSDTGERIELKHYDALLAAGSAMRDWYAKNGWVNRAWTWHEAADIRVFRPRFHGPPCFDVAWIGNWANERAQKFREFFVDPVSKLQLRAVAHGAGFPSELTRNSAHIEYRGWLPNFAVPTVLSEAKAAVHVPRRTSSIPSIRIFEAMACGTPLICSPWDDLDELFCVGEDFLVARDRAHMQRLLKSLLHDQDQANFLAAKGLSHILERHTCAHRVGELIAILHDIGLKVPTPALEAAHAERGDSAI